MSTNPFSVKNKRNAKLLPSDLLPNPEPALALDYKPVADVVEIKKAESKAVLGRPVDFYNEEELSLISCRQKTYMEDRGNDPAAEIFINQALASEIELQRIDHECAILEPNGKVDLSKDAVKDKLLLGKLRKEAFTKLTEALEHLGALPKDREQLNEFNNLSKMFTAYTDELNERKKYGGKIGQPSKEAMLLGKENGLTPNRYIVSGAISEEVRDEIFKSEQISGL